MAPSAPKDLVAALGGDAAAGAAPDLEELRSELALIAREVLDARLAGLGLPEAVRRPEFPTLRALHRDLQDSLLAELPRELEGFVSGLLESPEEVAPGIGQLQRRLYDRAQGADPGAAVSHEAQLQAALAEFLIFESVRLRLLAAVWSSDDFEALGGDIEEVDAIAWAEVTGLLKDPELADPSVRPLAVMIASASVSVAKDTHERAEALLRTDGDTRERLRMRAKLKSALRELRLPESILLHNALANLLGEDRVELPDLQEEHPLALEGMSRQAMDQRVSRGRRALVAGPEKWPRRKRPALFDLLRGDQDEDADESDDDD